MNFWSLYTHFNIYYSFWRFWNAASFNLVLTSFSLEYGIRLSDFCHFPVLARIFFWRSPGFVDHFCKQSFTYLVFAFFPFTKTNLPADPYSRFLQYWHFAQFSFLKVAGNIQHHVTIATATGRERGVGFEGLDPADLFAVDSLRWQWPVREEEGFERGFGRSVDFSFAFR